MQWDNSKTTGWVDENSVVAIVWDNSTIVRQEGGCTRTVWWDPSTPVQKCRSTMARLLTTGWWVDERRTRRKQWQEIWKLNQLAAHSAQPSNVFFAHPDNLLYLKSFCTLPQDCKIFKSLTCQRKFHTVSNIYFAQAILI